MPFEILFKRGIVVFPTFESKRIAFKKHKKINKFLKRVFLRPALILFNFINNSKRSENEKAESDKQDNGVEEERGLPQ